MNAASIQSLLGGSSGESFRRMMRNSCPGVLPQRNIVPLFSFPPGSVQFCRAMSVARNRPVPVPGGRKPADGERGDSRIGLRRLLDATEHLAGRTAGLEALRFSPLDNPYPRLTFWIWNPAPDALFSLDPPAAASGGTHLVVEVLDAETYAICRGGAFQVQMALPVVLSIIHEVLGPCDGDHVDAGGAVPPKEEE